MLSAIGLGPLMSPWVGVWDLVWESPETAIVLLGAMSGIAMAGLALSMLGRSKSEPRAQAVPVAVRANEARRPSRRRRR
jgi:hypothetical protein